MMRFRSYSSLVLLALPLASAFDRYAGYAPTTLITDYAAIDLDQEEFNLQLADRRVEMAMNIYEQGGHSGSYAILNITDGTQGAKYPVGTVVQGSAGENQTVTGTLLEAVTFTRSFAQVKVLYDVDEEQLYYVDCQVGGLWTVNRADRDGCFTVSGKVSFVSDGKTDEYSYVYDNRRANKNIRSLQLLSTNASTSMVGPDGVVYTEFEIFKEYYGDANYGDKWITSAARKQNTAFTSGRGDSDFSRASSRASQGEAMKKGTAYLNVWMEVVRELNEAVAYCKTDSDKAEYALDKAVAYYGGSLVTQEDSDGVLLYALAVVRAHQMKTAGHLDDKDLGDAYVNVDIFRELKTLQAYVAGQDPSLCDKVAEGKTKIVNLMKVPLVQSVIRYAYHQDKEPGSTEEEQEKMIAEGATYAAAILPFVHKCDSRAAEVIHKNMKFGVKANYGDVRKALESTYVCLGVTCESVGGIWDHANERYKATTCGAAETETRSAAGKVSMAVGICAGIILAGYVFLRYRHKIGFLTKKRKSLPPMYNTGNIAAVTEIA